MDSSDSSSSSSDDEGPTLKAPPRLPSKKPDPVEDLVERMENLALKSVFSFLKGSSSRKIRDVTIPPFNTRSGKIALCESFDCGMDENPFSRLPAEGGPKSSQEIKAVFDAPAYTHRNCCGRPTNECAGAFLSS